MKKTSLFLLIIGSVLLSGCVSSQRMARMSGGVFDEYSAPPSYRLRSKKSRKKHLMQIPSTGRTLRKFPG